MKIYVIGSTHQAGEIENKISKEQSIILTDNFADIPMEEESVVFDFLFDDSPDDIDKYSSFSKLHLFVNSTRISLAETTFFGDEYAFNLYGMAADSTFLERPLLEVTAHQANKSNVQDLLSKLGLQATVVDDRVGMVTPRIIAMIINEAYFTVMEKTASREDVDTGMKLGTNYPMGPFEWASKWGIGNIYDLLESLYMDTKDERYKICPLLKKEYLARS